MTPENDIKNCPLASSLALHLKHTCVPSYEYTRRLGVVESENVINLTDFFFFYSHWELKWAD